MLYNLLKFLMWLTIPIYYRRISVTGAKNIPARGPVILACNHPNSFFDAIVIGLYAPRQLNFLTRSDVFNAPWKKWLLSKMNMVPIYRMRDGIENLEKNQETFEKCREVMGRGGIILIFSEGLCIQEMKLRPLKKGTARIALDFAQNGKPLSVVAVGLTYPRPMQLRKDAFIGFAPAFNAADFATEFKENSARAILAFNKKLDESLRAQVVQVAEKKDEPMLQTLLEVWHNSSQPGLSKIIPGIAHLDQKIKTLPAEANIRAQVSDYTASLRQKEISDLVIAGKANISVVRFILGCIILLPAAVLSYVPFSLVRWITRTRVRLVEFKDSVMIAGGMVLSFVYSLLIILVASFFSWQAALTAMLFLIVLAKVSPWAYDGVVDYLAYWRNRRNFSALRTKREEIMWWITANLSPDSNPLP